MPQAVGLRAAALLGDPDRMPLAADQFGERIAEARRGSVEPVGNDQLRFQPAVVVTPQKADHRTPGSILQQLERNARPRRRADSQPSSLMLN